MANRTFKIARLNDERLFASLDGVAKSIGSYPDPLAIYFGESGGHALSVHLKYYKTNSLLTELLQSQSRAILTLNANFSSLGVSFHIARKEVAPVGWTVCASS